MTADVASHCVEAATYHAARGTELLAQGLDDRALIELRLAISLGGDQAPTLLNLALAEQRAGDARRAEGLMRDLERRFDDWDEPPLRLAELARSAGRGAEAEEAYRRVLEVNPKRPEALIGLAALLLARGDPASAQILLLRCCGVAPGRAEAWDALGLALMMTGDAQTAESAFAEAHRLAPASLDYALRRIEAALEAGSAEGELARLELASCANPLDGVLLTARGVLLERLGRLAEAADALEVALALDPVAKIAASALGRVLAASCRLPEAELALRRALALDPDDPQLGNNLAAVLMRLHQHAEARDLLAELVVRQGPQPTLLCNLANATLSLGLQEEAEGIARQAIKLAPAAVLPWRTLCNTLPYRDGASGQELLSALRSCSERLPRDRSPAFRNDADPDRRLRVGLLSGTLKTHPVGWLTIAGFEALDPASFEIIGLAQATADDPIARRFRAVAGEWHDVQSLDDAVLAQHARAIGIDVLIDLGGYGDAGRMPACGFRLAPVQVKWVGMQNHSTGLAEMDWFITDRWETPAELEPLYTERLLRMPDGYICYSPPAHAPDVEPLPALANGFITFGCLNNLAKITPRVITTWTEILRRVPCSRLILKTHQFAHRPTCERVLADFARHGIEPARIELRGSSAHRAFLAEYNRVDMVLDPFPYSGGLTTCEALWMGVPTLTLPGETFASRHSASHMSNAGLTDWVVPTLHDYIETAIAKASDPRSLADLRAGLRARVKASPLCDSARFGRSLAEKLRSAWREWCNERSSHAGRT